MEEYKFTVEEKDINKRLDVYISEKIENLTRSRIQSIIDESCVLVNDKIARSSYKVKLLNEVFITIPEVKEMTAEPQKIDIEIIYEDEDLIIVNKPQGLVTHPSEGTKDGTLVNAILYHCKDLSGIGGVLRPGIVHRLDKDTSGLLMIAKNDFTHQELSKEIQSKEAKRFYKAIAIGNFKEDTGIVDKPIGRHPKDRKKMAIVKDGREAVTHWNILERFGDYTFVELELKTGRTHQIRVHLSSIGHGIIGDKEYGPDIKFPINLKGQLLHAYKLILRHPRTNEVLEFTAPEPKYFTKTLDYLKRIQH